MSSRRGIVALLGRDGSAREGRGRGRLPQRHGRHARRLDPDRVPTPTARSSRRSTSPPTAGCRNRRVWADLVDGAPDGICIDSEGRRLVRRCPQPALRAGSGGRQVLQTIELDRGCFACMLGGPDGRTLFMMAKEWGGPDGNARRSTHWKSHDHRGGRAACRPALGHER